MDRFRVGISRCSLALSLTVKLGLAAWLASAVLSGPSGSVALTPPSGDSLQIASAVKEAQTRQRKRRARSASSAREAERKQEAGSQKASERDKEPESRAAPDKTGLPQGAETAKAAPDHNPAEAKPEAKEQVWSEAEIIAALEDCIEALAPIAAHVDVSKPIRSGQCGAPAPVIVKRVGATTPVEISPPAVVNCRMVARLHEWVESTLQPAAQDLLKAPVVRMINASGYTCRNRNGSLQDKISEHAFANALDISAFVTADRRTIDVLTHWGKTERDLRAIALARAEAERRAKEEAAAAEAAEGEKAKEGASADKSGKFDRSDRSEKGGKTEKLGRKDGPSSAPGKVGGTKDTKGVSGPDPEERAEPGPKTKRGRDLALSGRSNLGGGDPRSATDARADDDRPVVTTEGTFLRRLHKGACGPFSTVLGPEANEAHRNHFHFDLAERRSRRAFCE